MINPKALNAFINKPRDDWRWIKKAPLSDLAEEFADVPVHTTPYQHQWAAIALGVANPAFMFFLDMGLGKALHVDEPFLTPTGWKRMGDAQVGDAVIHPSGRTTKVTGVYPQGTVPLYNVMFSDGTSVRCCENHLWSLCDQQGHITETLSLAELRALIDQRELRIPLMQAPDFETDITTEGVILPASGKARQQELQSYMSSLGRAWTADGLWQLTPSSPALRQKIMMLARSVGYCTTPYTQDGELFHIDTACCYKTITHIEALTTPGEAICIKVAEDDGLFVTNNFTVTHNTKLLLDLLKYRKMLGEVERALVLVPNFTNIQSWVDEIQIHQPDIVGIGLEGSAARRRELLDAEGDVWIINYQGLQSLATTTVNRKRVLDEDAMMDLASRFQMIGMDEIHKCKNPESLTFEICDNLCDMAEYRYGLTGTPFGRNPMDLWAQFFLIDRGASLGAHPQLFKETFFNKTMNNAGFVDWEFDKSMKRLLNRMIQHRSIRYRDSECTDLPDQVFRQVRVPMGKDALRYQKELLAEVQERAMAGAMGDRQAQENIFIKMRMFASGFVRVYELDEEGNKTKRHEDIIFKEQPKLDALLDLIDSLPVDEKIVVFHEFIATGKMIEAALKKAKIKFLSLNAQTKDKKGFLSKFRNDDSYTVAVVNSKSGSTGLNLQRANHMAYFESPVSPIERQQSEKRTHRGGQERRCFYYDLITINSVDERIQDFIKEGKDLMQAVVEQKGGLLLSLLSDGCEAEKARAKKGRKQSKGKAK